MQVEQQTTTNKKTVTKKGGKSTKKSDTVEQENSQVVETIVQTESVEVSAPAETESQTAAAPVTSEAVNNEVNFQSVFDYLNTVSESLSEKSKLFKEENMDRETRTKIDLAFNKFNKAYAQFTRSYNDALLRQLNTLEKNGSKSSVKKTIVDKDKIAIHKKHNVHDFLLKFMNLPEGTQISRAQALTAITTYVKVQKATNPDIIVSDDKKSFKIIGDLKVLFDGIEKNLISTNKLTKPMPTQIKYTDIMTYMAFCFIKNVPTVV